jgi:hypothetical protein
MRVAQQRAIAYLDSVQTRLASHKGMISLREPHKGVILQSATGEELDALLLSVLDRAFEGALCDEILEKFFYQPDLSCNNVRRAIYAVS